MSNDSFDDFELEIDPNNKNDRENDYEDNADEPGFITARDLLSTLIKLMGVKGWDLRANPVGAWAGFDVYVKQPVILDGIECSVKVFKLLPDNMIESFLGTLYNTVTNEIASIADKEKGKEIIKKWKAIYSSFETPKEKNTVTYRMSASFLNSGWMRPISYTSRDGCYKLAPAISMIPETMHKLNVRDLLHMLPEAEQTILMLFLGRAVVGSKNQPIHGKSSAEVLEHSWRGWCLIQSDEAGIGKSTFLDLLAKVLTQFGYVIADVPPRLKLSFGWYDVATADVVISDDFNDENQQALMQSEYVKKIASNGRLTTEEKGVKNLSAIQSQSVIIGATNTCKQEHYIGLDQGSVSRANILCMHPQHTLMVGDNSLIHRWNRIAAEYDTTWECLMVYLLVRSKEMFIAAIEQPANKLEELYSKCREAYVRKPGLTVVTDIVRVAEELTAIVMTSLPDEDVDKAKAFLHNGFAAEHLLCVVHASLSGKGIGCKDLSRTFSRQFSVRYDDLKAGIAAGKTEIFKEITDTVGTVEGWRIPNKLSAYSKHWNVSRVLQHYSKYSALSASEQKTLLKRYKLEPLQDLFDNMTIA